MKKIVLLCVAGLLVLSACSPKQTKLDTSLRLAVPTSLDKLPHDYNLQQAIADDCVVYEDGDILSGQAVWDAFAEKCESGQDASVRLGFYYTLNKAQVTEEYYEQEKDNYPLLFIQDLHYDGEIYTLSEIDDEDPTLLNHYRYRYMKRYEGEPDSPTASFSSYIYYVLVNDDSVTWDEIMHGMFSSQWGAYIDHRTVYTTLN